MTMKTNIEVIAFDADDTLWVNEPYFRETEEKFSTLMEEFMPAHSAHKELFRTEIDNLGLYGYGIKGFILSMIETAIRISDSHIHPRTITQLIALGQEMLHKPIELLPGVQAVLEALQGKYKLVVATKGDLLDQERKLKKSRLLGYFHHIEVMSEKKEPDYENLLRRLDLTADRFLMVGNSLKSDVIPVLNLGGYACHVPFHTTWAHEHAELVDMPEGKFYQLEEISGLLDLVWA